MKVFCSPSSIAVTDPVDLQYVLFGRPGVPTLGAAGPTLVRDIEKFAIQPSLRAWDFLGIALGIVAADDGCLRDKSPDGWTREIDLSVSVQDTKFWQSQKTLLEQMLRFLTGDIWNLEFQQGGTSPPPLGKKKRASSEDCICLLSGGADSLTGAIDVVAGGLHPLFVSQISDGDKDHQKVFATAIAGTDHHLQLNHNIKSPGLAERSQRARSVLFIAYGIMAATSLDRYAAGESIKLFIPENGFISLNIPLTPLRRGSLSTRTTHPFYFRFFQQLLNNADLRVVLENPYGLKTKGELFRACKDQALLKKFVCQSTSCGRFARTGFMHCGRCVPCLVRRSAIHAYGIVDSTTYKYKNLSINDNSHLNFDDVRSACFAVQQVKQRGIQTWIGGSLSTTQLGDVKEYEALLSRGINELSGFLSSIGAL